jgi:hypothetical protein
MLWFVMSYAVSPLTSALFYNLAKKRFGVPG